MTDFAARVTVAIVTYHHSPWVEEALSSVAAQRPGAIILVDDASVDGTAQVARDWVKQQPNNTRNTTTVIQNAKNCGLNANLNLALANTTTDFFVYLAGDDWILPNRLHRQVKHMEDAELDLSYGDCLRADDQGQLHTLSFYERHPAWAERINTLDPFRELVLGGGNWIPAPSVMFRTATLRSLGGFDPEIAFEDYDMYSRLAAAHRLGFLDGGPLAVHREVASSLGSQLFLTGNRRWVEGRARTELKALGARPNLDAELAEKLVTRVLDSYKLGSSPSWVDRALAEIEPHLRKKPKAWLFYRLWSKLGMATPRVLTRLRRSR